MNDIKKRLVRIERLAEKSADVSRLYDRPRERGESQEQANARFLKFLQTCVEMGV